MQPEKNPHESIAKGSLTEQAKVWFYFIYLVILPTKHLSTVREKEAALSIYVSCQIVDSTIKMSLKFEIAKLFEDKQHVSFLCLGTSKTLSLGEFDES